MVDMELVRHNNGLAADDCQPITDYDEKKNDEPQPDICHSQHLALLIEI